MYTKRAVDLDSVPALVTPGIGLVGSQVKVSREGAPPGKCGQVLPAQDLPGQLWALQLKLWVPWGCYRLKHHIFSYHPVFQTCQGEERESSTPGEVAWTGSLVSSLMPIALA